MMSNFYFNYIWVISPFSIHCKFIWTILRCISTFFRCISAFTSVFRLFEFPGKGVSFLVKCVTTVQWGLKKHHISNFPSKKTLLLPLICKPPLVYYRKWLLTLHICSAKNIWSISFIFIKCYFSTNSLINEKNHFVWIKGCWNS